MSAAFLSDRDTAGTDVSFYERVYDTVRQIPHGHVTSYGYISFLIRGDRGAARTVGWALSALPEVFVDEVPWWRVINAQGRISNTRAEHGAVEQRRRLEAEGVVFDERGYVDWEEFGWRPVEW